MEDKFYRAVNCRSTFGVGNKDAGTGRCRLASSLFKHLSIQIGWIVKISLISSDTKVNNEIICTAWPITSNSTDDETVLIVDDTVQYPSSRGQIRADWMECGCKIIAVHPPSHCISVRMSHTGLALHTRNRGSKEIGGHQTRDTKMHAALYSGLPVAAGVIILAAGRLRTTDTFIRSVNGSGGVGVCVVSLNSITLPCDTKSLPLYGKDPDSATSSKHEKRICSSNSSNGYGNGHEQGEHTDHASTTYVRNGNGSVEGEDAKSDQATSCLAVVEELMARVVLPSLYLSPKMLLKGVLLLGPPGVGKTFAVKALKAACADMCTIHIKELSIPDILSSPDPISSLQSLLRTRQKSKQNRTSEGTTHYGNHKTATFATSSSNNATSAPDTPANTIPFRHTLSSSSSTPSNSYSFSPAAQKVDPSRVGNNSSATPSTPSTPYKWNLGSGSSSSTPFRPHTPSAPSSSSSSASALLPHRVNSSSWAERSSGSGGVSSEIGSSPSILPEMTILVIDEIDALGLPGNHTILQASIKQHLCAWFDQESTSDDNRSCIIATTNRPADVDPRLRRGGRFEREIEVTGSKQDRAKLILALLLALSSQIETGSHSSEQCGVGSSGNVTCLRAMERIEIERVADMVADRTGGYVAADITALVAEARKAISIKNNATPDTDGIDRHHMSAAARQLNTMFSEAMCVVSPSSLRGLSMQLPDLCYDDVIGCGEVKKCLKRILSFSSPSMRNRVKRFGLKSPGGALLYGPPGNSKTRLILAAAAHHGLPVISLSSADIYSPYVGDAEAEVRKAFRIARQASPCVLFLDELDALITDRASAGGSGVSVEARVLATLLTEMDGISSGNSSGGSSGSGEQGDMRVEESVIVMAATNRIDCIDAALLRKGRFHQTLFVPPPSESEKVLLLHYFAKRCRLLEGDVQCIQDSELFKRKGISGADVEGMCKERLIASVRLPFSVGQL